MTVTFAINGFCRIAQGVRRGTVEESHASVEAIATNGLGPLKPVAIHGWHALARSNRMASSPVARRGLI